MKNSDSESYEGKNSEHNSDVVGSSNVVERRNADVDHCGCTYHLLFLY